MTRTLAGAGNAEDPAVTGRQGLAGKPYAAVLPAEEEPLDDPLDEPLDDDFESDEDVDFESDDEPDVFVDEAGLALDDEPRLSLR
jgi:hypothetical protein